MTPTLEADPDCARPLGGAEGLTETPASRPAPGGRTTTDPTRFLRAGRRAFGDLDPATWDRLAAASPAATPFSSWAFHRAWWDAYGANAHDQTVVIVDDAAADPTAPVAIVPLMHRHVVEASDAQTHTMIRHADGPALTPLAPTACVVYFGASYHADYATILAAPDDLQAAADAVVEAFASDAIGPEHDDPWSAIDLRRLRSRDPATDALEAAFGAREMANGWTLNVEREDVCPVIHLPKDADLDGYLATLGKKERHEIRRKVRRAEAAGDVALVDAANPLEDLDAFIDLHQARWGADGLFPDTPGGAQSRHFFRRLFELADPSLHLAFLTVGGRRVAAAAFFETRTSILYYNAGVDPEARELSPGVVLLERLVRRAIDDGRCRVDLMRGDEPYKYEWGGVDEPVQRILVRRTAPVVAAPAPAGSA